MTTPRRSPVPLLGPTLDYLRDPLAMMRAQYDEHGPVSQLRVLNRQWSLLLGPDACSEALINKDKALSSGEGWGYLVGPFFNRGLMLLDFDEHRGHRRIMQAAFTRDKLQGYTQTLQPAVIAGLDAWLPQREFLAYPALKDLTLNLATQLFMGGAQLASADELDRLNRAFTDCVQAATALVRVNLPGTRWGRAHRGRRLLEQFLFRHIGAKRATLSDDLFSVLCHVQDDDGATFSDQDVVNHMIFLLMAAHDTSTITVSTMMHYLGQNKQWQQRCRDEALGLPELPSLSDLESLESLNLVMKESLRLVPPVPVLARRAVKDTTIQGVDIPKGRMVAAMVHLSHHMDEYWTDPSTFDPNRFAPDRREDNNHRHAWEPFGGGVHKCIGLFFAGAEITSIMVHLLRRFEWSVEPDHVTPLNYASLPYPRDGQPVDLRPLIRRPERSFL